MKHNLVLLLGILYLSTLWGCRTKSWERPALKLVDNIEGTWSIEEINLLNFQRSGRDSILSENLGNCTFYSCASVFEGCDMDMVIPSGLELDFFFQPTVEQNSNETPVLTMALETDRNLLTGIETIYAWDANWTVENISENVLVIRGSFIGNDEIRMGRIEVQMRR